MCKFWFVVNACVCFDEIVKSTEGHFLLCSNPHFGVLECDGTVISNGIAEPRLKPGGVNGTHPVSLFLENTTIPSPLFFYKLVF